MGECKRHTPADLHPEKTQNPLNKRLGTALGPIWKVAYNLAPTGIRSPDRPSRHCTYYAISAHIIFIFAYISYIILQTIVVFLSILNDV